MHNRFASTEKTKVAEPVLGPGQCLDGAYYVLVEFTNRYGTGTGDRFVFSRSMWRDRIYKIFYEHIPGAIQGVSRKYFLLEDLESGTSEEERRNADNEQMFVNLALNKYGHKMDETYRTIQFILDVYANKKDSELSSIDKIYLKHAIKHTNE